MAVHGAAGGDLPGVERVATAAEVAAAAAREADGGSGRVVQLSTRRRPKVSDLRAVLSRVADGMSVRAACRALQLHHAHVIDKLNSDAWRDQYASARQERGVVFGEKVIAVADAALRGFLVDEQGARHIVDPQQCRVAMQGYQWAAGTMAPKLMGPSALRLAADDDGGQFRLFIHD